MPEQIQATPPRKPLTVLFVSWAPFFSGAERALLLTMRNLDPARYRPFVILGTDGDMAVQLRQSGIPHSVIPLRHLDRRHVLAWASSVARVARAGWRESASLVHSNDMPSFQPGAWAGRLLGVPVVSHVRFPDTAQGFHWFFRGRLSRAFFVSEYLRSVAVEAAPDIFRGRSEVLYDGVSIPPLPDENERRSVRQELGLAAGETVVALTGQISEIKGIWEFIEAARLLVARGTRARFVVLGDDLRGQGALRRDAEARVAAMGLGASVSFLGFRPDAPRLIPAFDIVAVPSHIEPLGNATLEAMAAAKPVIGSRVGGIPEMVVDGETGLLVEPKNAASLAEGIGRLIDSPEERTRLGHAGRKRAETEFGLARHAERLQGLYDEVLATQ